MYVSSWAVTPSYGRNFVYSAQVDPSMFELMICTSRGDRIDDTVINRLSDVSLASDGDGALSR